MAQYESLKDYLSLNRKDEILKKANEYFQAHSDVKNKVCLKDITIITVSCVEGILPTTMVFMEVSAEVCINNTTSASSAYYGILFSGNVLKGFSGLNLISAGEISEKELHEENIPAMFGLPDITCDTLEEEAQKIHRIFCAIIKKDPEHKYWFPVIEIKEKYKLKMWPAKLDDGVLGQIRFTPSRADIYDIRDMNKCFTDELIPANAILINSDYYNNHSTRYDDIIVAAHELVHWNLHRMYFYISQLLDDNYQLMNCSSKPIVFDDSMSLKDRAYWYAEWQANELAIRVAMPKHLVEKAIEEYNNDESVYNPADIPFSGMYYQNMIYKLSWDFNVPKEVMKIRLRQLGYDYADGTFVTVDNCIYPPFTFPRGTLREDETFVIDRDNYERLLLDNEEFSELIGKRYFVYTGYVVCYNHPKYIKHKFSHGVTEYVLSDYAREHVDECCYKFKYTYTSNNNSFTEYTTSQYLCKLDDIILTITTDADNKGVTINAKQLKKIFDKLKEDEKKAEKTKATMILANITTFSAIFKYHKEQIKGLTYEKIEDTYGIPVNTLKAYVAPENSSRYRKPSLEHMMLLCHAFHLPHDTAIDFLTKAKTPLDENNALHMLYDNLLRITDEPMTTWNKYLTENGEAPLRDDT